MPTLRLDSGRSLFNAILRKRPDCGKGHPFQTRQQIAAKMIRDAHACLPGRTIRIAADGQYATKRMVAAARECRINLVSRMRSDAAVYELPAKRKRPGRGRSAKRGRRMPTPKVMAARRKKGWRSIQVRMYGKTVERRVLPITCLWYHVDKDHPAKLLIIRDPEGKQNDDFAFCTDPATPDEQIVERFAGRWPIEECIRDGKQHGGFE